MHVFAPYFGYLASLFLVIALLVSNDIKFRWFNAAGNITFITYALVIHAFPVLLTNSILLTINLHYLIKIYKRHEDFDLIEFKGEEKIVTKFLQFYQSDIQNFFPQFKSASLNGNLNFVILRDLVIANLFSANLTGNGDAEVLINFTLKKYRDYKVGLFIFEKEKQFLISKGVKCIVYKTEINKNHRQFLKVMGFVKEKRNGSDCYVKVL